jgi:hypothetical protein
MYYSQLARFYALQGLAFWAGAIATYQLFTQPPRGLKLGLLVVGTLAAHALALHLSVNGGDKMRRRDGAKMHQVA